MFRIMWNRYLTVLPLIVNNAVKGLLPGVISESVYRKPVSRHQFAGDIAKSPGNSHREGISLVALFAMLPDGVSARQWFENTLWLGGYGLLGWKRP